jgi:glycosyltransferase involved in cell wall biosynthesis
MLKPEQARRITWLVPDDRGGGVVSVAQACCRQAVLAGHDVTLLMLLPPTGHAAEFGGFRVESLEAKPPYADAPQRIVDWLGRHRQDIVVLNACEQADVAIPHAPAGTRVIFAVHDTAPRYCEAGLRHEAAIDAVVAVSETVASRFRHHLQDPDKLRIVHNGAAFPVSLNAALSSKRLNDIVFLGGNQPAKGAFDAIALWKVMHKRGFAGRLHWFGQVGEALRSEIARLPGSDRIVMYGWAPRRRIFETAACSRIVLVPSRVESFGMGTIECMGMGCLATAWDVDTGTREIVSGEDGAFAPLGDYDRLADCVFGLLAEHEQRYRASTVRIRSKFDDRAMWTRYCETFAWMNGREPAQRPGCDTPPPPYKPPVRMFQRLPRCVRETIRNAVGRSPRLGYWLRDFRGR